jgi:hypothetical protein
VKTEGAIFLDVHDEFAPWNLAIYHISENGVDVFRKEKENVSCMHPSKRGVQLDISTENGFVIRI